MFADAIGVGNKLAAGPAGIAEGRLFVGAAALVPQVARRTQPQHVRIRAQRQLLGGRCAELQE